MTPSERITQIVVAEQAWYSQEGATLGHDGYVCVYLGERDGAACRCSVGVLLTPDAYNPDLEGGQVDEWGIPVEMLTDDDPLYTCLYGDLAYADADEVCEFLVAMQKLHDDIASDDPANTAEFLERLTALADGFKEALV